MHHRFNLSAVENCKEIDSDPTKCKTCNSDSILSNDKSKCFKNCVTIDSTNTKCKKCDSNSVLKDGTCTSCGD
jgi:hypothetical protein